jgi:dolichol kinase
MEDRARILEERIENLAHVIVETINAAEIPERPDIRLELKDFAISVLQDAIVPAEPAGAATERTYERFNPLAMGIPLFFAGGVLFFLFPPVGMMLFAAAVVMVVWGLMASLVARR